MDHKEKEREKKDDFDGVDFKSSFT